MIVKIRPKSHQKYLSLPILGIIIDEFTDWSYERGYAIDTIKSQICYAVELDDFFVQRGIKNIEELSQTDFETAWKTYRLRRNFAGAIRQIELFLIETRRLQPAILPPKTPSEIELEDYSRYLREVRGYCNRTIQYHCSYIQEFLDTLGMHNIRSQISDLTLEDVDRFVVACSKRMNRYSLQHVVAYLRSFLKFKYERGILTEPFFSMIESPRTYRMEKLPRSYPWEMISSLLKSINTGNAHGIRDYTILFLMATYGLRASDTASLTLDDIDWRAGTIRIQSSKTKSENSLPMTNIIKKVLIRYLRESRPLVAHRELFIRMRAPYVPIKPASINDILESRVNSSGLDIKISGTHSLRHSYATHLLRQGLPLKTIGDLLGHRDAESTCVYLRLAIDDLREVALEMPKESMKDVPSGIQQIKYTPPRKRKNNQERPSSIKSPEPNRSFFSEDIQKYINLKRSLGVKFQTGNKILLSFDMFAAEHFPEATKITADLFNDWCAILHDFSPTVRRRWMSVVRNFCLYLSRFIPRVFIPDILTFPADHRPINPFIYSEQDISRLICAAGSLQHYHHRPLRPQTIRLAIILLYTTGLRRGELLRLKISDFDPREKTLFIKDTKFRKSRIVPLSLSVFNEIIDYLDLRYRKKLPIEIDSPLILNSRDNRAYSNTAFRLTFFVLCSELNIFTRKGKTPRIHDLRHTFAVKALQRWYENNEDVQAKLPLLSTYMGHISINSTHYYLQLIEGIRSEASERFYECFGKSVTKGQIDQGGER